MLDDAMMDTKRQGINNKASETCSKVNVKFNFRVGRARKGNEKSRRTKGRCPTKNALEQISRTSQVRSRICCTDMLVYARDTLVTCYDYFLKLFIRRISEQQFPRPRSPPQ